MDAGETSRAAAARELAEETGVHVATDDLRQIGVRDQPNRDSRGRYVTVDYLAIVPANTQITAGDDARGARWWPLGRWAQHDFMDETTAALLVAGIGLVGALLGAVVGGMAAVRGAKHSADAALRQVEVQAQVEQARWLRERRHEACASLHSLLTQILQEAVPLRNKRRRESNRAEVLESVVKIGHLSADASRTLSALALLGPAELAHKAGEALTACVSLENTESDWDERMDRFDGAFWDFRDAAQATVQGA